MGQQTETPGTAELLSLQTEKPLESKEIQISVTYWALEAKIMLNPEREIEMVKDPREFGLRVSIKMGNLIYKCFCQLLLREPQELAESF